MITTSIRVRMRKNALSAPRMVASVSPYGASDSALDTLIYESHSEMWESSVMLFLCNSQAAIKSARKMSAVPPNSEN